jgi:hypothetical protein
MFFSTYPSVVEGFHLNTWRGGPQAGQPKIPPTAKGLLERASCAWTQAAGYHDCSLLTLGWPSFGQ